MGRIERGFRLARASLEVLRSDRELMILPLVSTLAILVFAGAILSPVFIAGFGGNRQALWVLLAIVYFVSSFIATFSNAALVAAATDRMNGGEGKAADGLRTAWARVDKLIAWAALSATVGLILRGVEQRGGVFGAIVGRIAGVAWSVITFFVVPVLVFEPLGPIEAVKRSAAIFRQRWGEQFVGNASIGIALFVVMIPAVLLCVMVATVSVPLAVVLGVVAFGALIAVGGALSGIFNAALYRYATAGELSGPFQADDLNAAFRPRRSKGGFSSM
jgi:Family of unknown function (DUF6159)